MKLTFTLKQLLWIAVFSYMVSLAACASFNPDAVSKIDYEKREPAPPANLADDLAHYEPVLDEGLKPERTATPNIELSVEQSIVLALHNNPELHIAQLNPVIAGTFEQAERSLFSPELFAEAEYSREKANEISRSTGEGFEVEGRDASATVGIQKFFPSGTTVELSTSQRRNISDRAPEQQVASVGLSVTQSLLRGLGPAVNMVSVKQAQLNTLASTYELRCFTEALVAEIEIAYWEYVLYNQEISIFEQSLTIAKQQLNEVLQRIDVGIIPEIEAAAARAEVAHHQQSLIDAHSLLESKRLMLIRLLNPGDWYDLNIVALSEPNLEPVPLDDCAERLELALQSRPDLQEAQLRLKQNRLETIKTRNGLLPRLDLFIALDKTGYADTFTGSFEQIDESNYEFTAGLELSHYLGRRRSKAYDTAAWANREQAAKAVANLRQIIGYEVRLAINEVERARKQMTATKVSRTYQEETLRAEEERFDVGETTAIIVAKAQRDLLASRIAEVEAVVNYRIGLVKLYLAEGSLLDRRGIQIQF